MKKNLFKLSTYPFAGLPDNEYASVPDNITPQSSISCPPHGSSSLDVPAGGQVRCESIDSVRRAQEYLAACLAAEHCGPSWKRLGLADQQSGDSITDTDTQPTSSDPVQCDSEVVRSSSTRSDALASGPAIQAPSSPAGEASDFQMLLVLSHDQPFSTASASTESRRASAVNALSPDEWQPAFITLDPTPIPELTTDTGTPQRSFRSRVATGQTRPPRPKTRFIPRETKQTSTGGTASAVGSHTVAKHQHMSNRTSSRKCNDLRVSWDSELGLLETPRGSRQLEDGLADSTAGPAGESHLY